MRTDCGCGCGGDATRTSAFVRPRFFAGQLLTEDDLSLLVEYTTAKARLHNRSLYGQGVICGLGVTCDPCGGGTVAVHPGHALDCAGNDIVVPCTERVDVQALLRERRISGLGVDCGENCDDEGGRSYGLYVRYRELPVEPVAPYATEEPCPSPGCVPSRIQEGYQFVVKCDDFEDHRHNPGTRLLMSLGDLARADRARTRDRRLGHYTDALAVASLATGRAFRFDAADAGRYATALAWLRENAGGEGPPSPPTAREMTEHVRALAAAVARYDTYDPAGQEQLGRDYPDLATVREARGVLGTACERLKGADMEASWPDPLRRTIAHAVVTETAARVVPERGDPDAPLEVRMLAQGTPLAHALRVEFRADLGLIREWLLCRLDQAADLADCALRTDVAAADVPPLLPPPPPDSTEKATVAEVQQIAEAAAVLGTALRRFLTDAACATLNPPCGDRTDTDVLLARLELDGCDVVRVCSATREQVLPGGSAYGEWLPKLYRLRELAERVCCLPVPRHQKPTLPSEGPVARPYADDLLGDWPRTGDLEEMLSLLLTPAPGETPPKALHEQVYTTPSEVTDSMQELARLRTQVSDLTAAVEGLRAQLGSARTQMTHLEEQVPERLGTRLADLEDTSDRAADQGSDQGPDQPDQPDQPGQGPEQGAEAAKPPAKRGRSPRTRKPGETP
ncbi:coiled-coil domain-containing protein [Streptomyces sp. NPDC059474]|uniref:coiled-coil domain-containing protein n=1 Tax=Streptomyces sp. NPDC059474 TaxID=3346846 RepID=UPI0036B9F06B